MSKILSCRHHFFLRA